MPALKLPLTKTAQSSKKAAATDRNESGVISVQNCVTAEPVMAGGLVLGPSPPSFCSDRGLKGKLRALCSAFSSEKDQKTLPLFTETLGKHLFWTQGYLATSGKEILLSYQSVTIHSRQENLVKSVT